MVGNAPNLTLALKRMSLTSSLSNSKTQRMLLSPVGLPALISASSASTARHRPSIEQKLA